MRRRAVLGGIAALSTYTAPLRSTAAPSLPLIIAHRGASGVLPEHTLESYTRAHEMGADVIEADLVFTKDGHLICRHDRYLSTTTNVSDIAAFKSKQTVKAGAKKPDWFAEDFTLDEIKSLKARQAFSGRSTAFDDSFEIPTFAELLSMATQYKWCLYPEIKAPAIALRNGHDILAALAPFRRAAADGAIGPSFLQCFDPAFLKPLDPMKNIKRIQLLYQTTPDVSVLARIAKYADGVGPNKTALLSKTSSSGFIEAAHALGLSVHPWTFRDDDVLEGFADAADELQRFFELGVDGVFTDFTDTALKVRARWSQRR